MLGTFQWTQLRTLLAPQYKLLMSSFWNFCLPDVGLLCAVFPPPLGVESADMLRCTHHQELTLSSPPTATRTRHLTQNNSPKLSQRQSFKLMTGRKLSVSLHYCNIRGAIHSCVRHSEPDLTEHCGRNTFTSLNKLQPSPQKYIDVLHP